MCRAVANDTGAWPGTGREEGQRVTDRQAAFTYAVAVASGLALLFLMAGHPNGRNLAISVIVGALVGIGSLIYQSRR